jgi:sulfide dehydrogenase subunit beta
MFKILEKRKLASQVFFYVLDALDISRKALPGHFVIIRLNETGERIPITIADADPERGTLTFYVQAIGKTSIEMSLLNVGDSILDVVGPLGNPSEMDLYGTVVLVGGGFGIAAIHPIARALTLVGNKTISILGVQTKERVIMEDEMLKASSEVRVVTNDGSYGDKGLVTDLLQTMIDEHQTIDRVIAIGPLIK